MSPLVKYQQRVDDVDSLLCVGLDSDVDHEKFPQRFLKEEYPQFAFNKWVIEQTHEFVSAFKPNIAFYEARGVKGVQEYAMTIEYLKSEHPEIFTISDAKRGDIGSTNTGYVKAIFDELGFDAVTLIPYVGLEGLQPFLDRADKASIVLCRTSNPGAGQYQDVTGKDGKPVWQKVAEDVSKGWPENGMLVVGATYPDELAEVREIVGEMTLLVPGIGAQGGDVEKTVKAGLNAAKRGMIINSSRGIIFSQDPGAAAKSLRDEINEHR